MCSFQTAFYMAFWPAHLIGMLLLSSVKLTLAISLLLIGSMLEQYTWLEDIAQEHVTGEQYPVTAFRPDDEKYHGNCIQAVS